MSGVLKRARDSGCADEEVSMERFLYACTVSPFQGEIGNSILSIETGFSVPGKPLFHSGRFFFRECCARLWSTIDSRKASNKAAIFFGIPGTGKTIFGILALIHPIANGNNVFYNNAKQRLSLFFRAEGKKRALVGQLKVLIVSWVPRLTIRDAVYHFTACFPLE